MIKKKKIQEGWQLIIAPALVTTSNNILVVPLRFRVPFPLQKLKMPHPHFPSLFCSLGLSTAKGSIKPKTEARLWCSRASKQKVSSHLPCLAGHRGDGFVWPSGEVTCPQWLKRCLLLGSFWTRTICSGSSASLPRTLWTQELFLQISFTRPS